MTKHLRPQKVYDFAGHAARQPNIPPPGDRLNAQFEAHAEAIVKIQQAVEALGAPLTVDRLDPKFVRGIVAEAKSALEAFAIDSARAAGRAAAAATHAANAAKAAEGASAPALASAQAILAAERDALIKLERQAELVAQLQRKLEDLEQRPGLREPTDPVGILGPNAGGPYAGDKAGATATAADYSETAIYWAEWMGPGGIGTAGHTAASDVIPDTILKINAISGDHWSSRWWAHRAAEAVGGQLAYLYLGPYPGPPLTTPSGGVIPIGAIYWNTTNGQMYVWNGTSWLPFNSPTKAATSSLFYTAAAGQTVFNLGVADMFGSSHILKSDGSEGTEVYFNGVRLTPVSDYAVDPVANTVTLVNPAPAGSVVGIDVMTDPSLLAPVLALTGKLRPWVFDGVQTTFPLIDSAGGTRTAVDAAQLFITLDGVDQEPGVDFTLDVGGTSVIFLVAPTADSKSFCVMMFRTATGFLSFVTHDNTLTGDGTVTLPLGVVNATANSTQRGAVYVPGLAGTVPNHLTINALTGELGATTALQTQVQAGTDAIQPLTSANLRAVNGLPVSSLTTVQKTVVPAINEINAQLLYRGVWQVAANSPNLTPPLVPPAANGWTWIAQTANPAVPEIVPAGITGIVGQTVATGDHIVWTGAAYTIVPGSSLTRPQADLLYVNVTGDTMTGALQLPAAAPTLATQATNKAYVDAGDALLELEKVNRAGDTMTGELHIPVGPPSANDVAANKLYVDNAIASNALYRGPWHVAANNPDLVAAVATNLNGWSWIAQTVDPLVPEFAPAGMPGIGGQQVDTGDRVIFSTTGNTYQLIKGSSLSIVEGDARYLNTAGDTATGPLILAADPVAALEAATKQYTDAQANLKVDRAGDTMTGSLIIGGLPGFAGQLQLNRTVIANNPLAIVGKTNNQNRWSMYLGSNQAETGANAGANFALYRWNDAGTVPTQVLGFDRDTGQQNTALVSKANISLITPAVLTLAADPTANLQAATKQYVDAADLLNVKKAGDTMTGQLLLVTPPVGATAATSKTYVDAADALRVLKAGDTMTGQLTLPASAPIGNQDAATKIYVDTAIASGNLYQGQWQVAANIPNLTPPTTPVSLNGYSWIAQTVDPNVPEVAPAGLPGIGGQTVFNGDTIRWNAGLAVYERFQGSSLTIAQADTLYVKQAGDTMTGYLLLNADPTLPAGAATKNYVDVLTAAKVSKAGDTMTGTLTLPITAPTQPAEAANKQYVDVTVATNSLYQGIYTVTTNIPDLRIPPMAPLNGYSWVTQTTDPLVPDLTVVALPGIPLGTSLDSGWTIRYNGNTSLYEVIKGPNISLTTAATQFVDVVGDTMTGSLGIQGEATGVYFASTPPDAPGRGGAIYYKSGYLTLQESSNGTQPVIVDNNGTNRRAILDSLNGVLKAGDTMTGGLSFGSSGVTNNYDSSRHITLYGTGSATSGYGFGITGSRLNYTVSSGANHFFLVNGVDVAAIGTGGVQAYAVPFNYRGGPNTTGVNVIKTDNAKTYGPRVGFNAGTGGMLGWFYANQMQTFSQYGAPEGNLTAVNHCGGYGDQTGWWLSVASPPNFNANGDVYARGVKLTSDPALKRDVREVDRSEIAAAFAHLKPIRFRWKPMRTPSKLGHDGFIDIPQDPLSEREQWGFSADDIERANPNLVSVQQRTHGIDTDGNAVVPQITEEVKHYDLAGVVAILTAKLREMEDEIKALKEARH